ncbi:hypothetical protein DIPPA_03203 [Diplonema papillatum]|nr:hypothetical protein DIPPA_03203 [Diplonema papillatum]
MNLLACIGLLFLTASGARGDEKESKRSRKPDFTFPVQYSFDGEKWKDKGTIMVGRQVWFEDAFKSWPTEDVAAIASSQRYFIRVAADAAAPDSSHQLMLSVSVCELVNAAFAEHYRVTFAPHDDNKNVIIGLAPYGAAYTKVLSPLYDACASRQVFDERLSKISQAPTHSVVLADSPPQRPATFSAGARDDALFEPPVNKQAKRVEKERAAENGEAPPPEEKSWWERNWFYLVLAFLIIRLY